MSSFVATPADCAAGIANATFNTAKHIRIWNIV